MPTQRAYAAACALCTIIIFSCASKKETTVTTAVSFSNRVPDTVNIATASAIDLSSFSQAYVQSKTQHFKVKHKEITVVKARKGLHLIVDPSVLQQANGKAIDADIEIAIIELTTAEELFKANAATISNGRLLQSGGSYYINMKSHGEDLKLKTGAQLRVLFPQLKEQGMELFYGNRDSASAMNWTKANTPLSFRTTDSYMPYNPPYAYKEKHYLSKYFLYQSTGSAVYFEDKKTTLLAMVTKLQKRGVDKLIDTVCVNCGWARDSVPKYYYGCMAFSEIRAKPVYMFRIMSSVQQQAERDSAAMEAMDRKKAIAANDAYYAGWQKVRDAESLAYRLQNYYAPSSIDRLGWINCDRFYNQPTDAEVPLELPITLQQPLLQYFIIYRGFNGLINGYVAIGAAGKYALKNLPAGEPVTLIAFTRSNGQIFQAKQDFTIQKNKAVKLDFQPVSDARMKEIFGNTVNI